MTGDLPDYTRLIVVSVDMPEIDVGPVNVARYQVTPITITDGDRAPLLIDDKGRLYVKIYGADIVSGSNLVIARPKGGILEKGSVTTTADYETVASVIVTADKTFQLAKILISCNQTIMYRLRWCGTVISAEVIILSSTPFTDWFPWDYKEMIGDGAKAFDIQVKYPVDGEAGDCYAEIVGEEVDS